MGEIIGLIQLTDIIISATALLSLNQATIIGKFGPYSVMAEAGQSLMMERTNGTIADATIHTTGTKQR